MAEARHDPRLHVIYRGCTHPATFAGVPIVPFVVVTIAFALPGFWTLPFGVLYSLVFWLAYLPALLVMRMASRKDPYALLQFGQRMRLRLRHRNKSRWNAVTFTPFRYRK